MALQVRNITIGEGRPKVCVPLTADHPEGLVAQAERACQAPCDLVEVRIDYFVKENGTAGVGDVMRRLRTVLGEMPILFTFRTKKEGGEAEIGQEAYVALIRQVVEEGLADLVDVEYNLGEGVVSAICEDCRKRNFPVVLSNHDFEKTVERKQLLERMKDMARLGGSVVKVAMMPRDREDVLSLMEVSLAASRQLSVPIITMSMGSMGSVTRLCGELTGSAVTFATAGACSAPGQMAASGVMAALELLHGR